jgi:hypothetical protein
MPLSNAAKYSEVSFKAIIDRSPGRTAWPHAPSRFKENVVHADRQWKVPITEGDHTMRDRGFECVGMDHAVGTQRRIS